MKVGTIAAPCRYDAASRDALQSEAVAAKSHSIVQCGTVARPKRFELLTPRFVGWPHPLSQNKISANRTLPAP